MRKALFGAHPYGFTVPEPDAIAKVTRDSLKQFAATHYVPNDAHARSSSATSRPSATLGEVKKAFGDVEARAGPAGCIDAVPEAREAADLLRRPPRLRAVDDPHRRARHRRASRPTTSPLRTADTIFGGAFYSRLTRNIREAKGYTYSPYSTADCSAATPATFYRRRRGAQ